MASLCQKYGVAPRQITDWKAEFLAKADSVFATPDKEGKELKELKQANDKLLKKVGQLTVEVDFFCGSLRDTVSKEAIESLSDRRPVGISRNRYCEPAGLNRTSNYYKRKGESAENQTVMRKIDEYYQGMLN